MKFPTLAPVAPSPPPLHHHNMDANTSSISRKVEEIQTLIKHSNKDSSLRKTLESQFEDILDEQQKLAKTPFTYANAASLRKQVAEFQAALDTFRRWVVKQIAKSRVIKSPQVIIRKTSPNTLNNAKVLASRNLEDKFDQVKIKAQADSEEEEEDSSDASSDYEEEEDDLFERIENSSTRHKEKDTPGKRIRKQVFRPDFITSKPIKKSRLSIKMEDDDMHEDDDGTMSSTEGESPPSRFQNSGKGQQEFPCPICRKIFRKKGHMTRHLLTHEPEKPFGCDFCPKRFAAKYSLQMHLLNRHNTDAKPFECELCERRFTLKKELDQHTQSHKDGFKPRSFQCLSCDLKFITQGDLDSHTEMSHPELEDAFNCGSCDKSFPRKYSLIRHERTHVADKQYHCAVCNKEFGTKNGLQMHLQAHELEDKAKPLTCHICGKKFAVEQNLDMHILYHNQSEEKPYCCELCEVRFKTQERLDKHIDTHGSSEGRVYPCQYCEKTFPRKYNLIRHELSHTHGRRKPKEGMPTPIPRIQEQREQRERDRERRELLHATGHYNNVSSSERTTRSSSTVVTANFSSNGNGNGSVSTDDENTEVEYNEASSSSSVLFHEFEIPADSSGYSYVYQTVSKSDLYAALFGLEEESWDGISPPFSKQKYTVLKFENY